VSVCSLSLRARRDEPLHLVVDSTGIKVFGEGEWKVRQHGYTYRRTWRKLHLGVDEASGEVVAAVVTTSNYNESEILPALLDQIEAEIEQVSGDGAYDKRTYDLCNKAIHRDDSHCRYQSGRGFQRAPYGGLRGTHTTPPHFPGYTMYISYFHRLRTARISLLSNTRFG
jgi:Transposase DDE domain